jgi:hypothetical protein
MGLDKKTFSDRLLAISERNKGKPGRGPDGSWNIEKKLEVVGQWLIMGNMKLVAATSGVDYNLIRKWKGQPWWPEMVAELRATQNIEMDTKITDIIQKSLDATYDRVVNGDYVYDPRTGQVLRRPAPLKDVHRVAADLLQRREMLRGKFEDAGGDKAMSVEEHLKILANNMAKWFEKEVKQPVIELEEIEDAVYAQRKEGLQEGERTLQLSPGECEEEGGEEYGEAGTSESGEGTQG